MFIPDNKDIDGTHAERVLVLIIVETLLDASYAFLNYHLLENNNYLMFIG